jgi:hypothetical protein
LKRELVLQVGVLAEKRQSKSRWVSEIWVPVAVLPGATRLKEGDMVFQDDVVTRYFMGVFPLTMHAAETEAYVHNFNARTAALYVVLRRSADGVLPWTLHDVSASPYAAQDYEDCAEDIVERVAMPADIEVALKAFIETFHTEEVFKKRRRDKLKVEEQKFGKEPIFLQRQRDPEGKLDG